METDINTESTELATASCSESTITQENTPKSDLTVVSGSTHTCTALYMHLIVHVHTSTCMMHGALFVAFFSALSKESVDLLCRDVADIPTMRKLIMMSIILKCTL